jgi:outer membrane lipoprotein SlyB
MFITLSKCLPTLERSSVGGYNTLHAHSVPAGTVICARSFSVYNRARQAQAVWACVGVATAGGSGGEVLGGCLGCSLCTIIFPIGRVGRAPSSP